MTSLGIVRLFKFYIGASFERSHKQHLLPKMSHKLFDFFIKLKA